MTMIQNHMISNLFIYIYIHTHTYIYIYIWLCVEHNVYTCYIHIYIYIYIYSPNRVYTVGVLTVLLKGHWMVQQPVRAAGKHFVL